MVLSSMLNTPKEGKVSQVNRTVQAELREGLSEQSLHMQAQQYVRLPKTRGKPHVCNLREDGEKTRSLKFAQEKTRSLAHRRQR